MAGSNKSQILSIIQRAKSAHLQWRAYAQGLVAGVAVDGTKAPVKHTDCKFGQWYHGEGKTIFGDSDIFTNIGAPHEMLHSVYDQIYTLVAKKKFDKANEKLKDLLAISRTLLDAIDVLEQHVERMD